MAPVTDQPSDAPPDPPPGAPSADAGGSSSVPTSSDSDGPAPAGSSSSATSPLDAATQKRLLALWGAQPIAGEAAPREHLFSHEGETHHHVGRPGVPVWAGHARTLLSSCSFRTLVHETSQEYTSRQGGTRREAASIVLASILKPGHECSFRTVKPVDVLIAFTSAVASGESPFAAQVSLIEENGGAGKMKCSSILTANIPYPSSMRESSIHSGNNKQFATLLAHIAGVFPSVCYRAPPHIVPRPQCNRHHLTRCTCLRTPWSTEGHRHALYRDAHTVAPRSSRRCGARAPARRWGGSANVYERRPARAVAAA